MKMTEEMYQQMLISNEIVEERNEKDTFYWSEEDALTHAYRKRDWHKNKGKRRIKGGYKGDRYV